MGWYRWGWSSSSRRSLRQRDNIIVAASAEAIEAYFGAACFAAVAAIYVDDGSTNPGSNNPWEPNGEMLY